MSWDFSPQTAKQLHSKGWLAPTDGFWYSFGHMKRSSIKQFLKLHHQLESERADIIARLQQVEAALGASEAVLPWTATRKTPVTKRKRAKNELSLKEALVQAVKGKSLTKEEILAAVQKLGYQFITKNPLNSMNVVLYGKQPKFKRQNGKFSLA